MVNIRHIGATIVLSCATLVGTAQTSASNSLPSGVEQAKSSSVWLTSSNPAAMRLYNEQSYSYVEAYANKANGGLVDYYESDDSYKIGAITESIYRLTDKLTLQGGLNYERLEGKNMSGSVFIDPYYNPFNVTEIDDSNSGIKVRESYKLNGGLTYTIGTKFSLGTEVDFEASNYTKMTDLRHKNRYSNIKVNLGAMYSIGKAVDLGVSYSFRKSVEGVSFYVYGTTDALYISLIDYGGFWGTTSAFSTLSSGYVTSSTQPMYNGTHSGEVQLGINLSQSVTLFANLGYSKRDGYHGTMSNSSPINSEHHGTGFNGDAALQIKTYSTRHRVQMSFSRESLENYETLYEESGNSTTGSSQIIYYDPVLVGKRSDNRFKIGYTGEMAMMFGEPRLRIAAHYSTWQRSQTAVLYPLYRMQKFKHSEAVVSVEHNIVKSLDNRYTIALSGGYNFGTYETADESYIDSSSGEVLAESEMMLQRNEEYLTTPRAMVAPSFRYSRIMGKYRGYAELSYRYSMALKEVTALGSKHHQIVSLSVGCSF